MRVAEFEKKKPFKVTEVEDGQAAGVYDITPQQALAVRAAMPSREAMMAALGVDTFVCRRMDRVLQELRRADLATFTRGEGLKGKPGTWAKAGS